MPEISTNNLTAPQTTNQTAPRLIAFYLPQYHPIPENDAWWGRGFTEWRNVVQAESLFPGHYQPHLPADLGFYDLRVSETRQAQADLAREHGIYGFCYYHYWFNGKRLLNRPFDEVLASGQPDFPFCLCWANENWSRAWDGREKDILIEQVYSDEDDLQHIRWLAQVFQDRRYIRIDNKPIFLIYRAQMLPDPVRMVTRWRDEARRLGIGDIFLCRVESNFQNERGDPTELGFDGAVEFQPDAFNFGARLQQGRFWDWLRRLGLASKAFASHYIFDYSSIVEKALQKSAASYCRFPCVAPAWDSTPRRKKNAHILYGSTSALYEKWLRTVVRGLKSANPNETFVFINAWNEWAEGCHLEPDLRFGRAYLEATRRALLVKEL